MKSRILLLFACFIPVFAVYSHWDQDSSRILLPCSEQNDSIAWKYTNDIPDRNWYMENFNDSAWLAGFAGFGNRDESGNQVRSGNLDESGLLDKSGPNRMGSEWNSPALWMRKEFLLEGMPEGRLHINILAQNTVSSIYVNGKKLGVFSPTDNIHEMTDFDNILREVLQPGTNIIAVYSYAKDPPINNRTGLKQQFIDVGIIEVLE